MILAAIKPPAPPQVDMESTLNQMKQMWNELDREQKHFLVNDAVLGSVDISTEPDKSGDKTTKLRNPK